MEYGNGAINPPAQVRNAGNQNLLFYYGVAQQI